MSTQRHSPRDPFELGEATSPSSYCPDYTVRALTDLQFIKVSTQNVFSQGYCKTYCKMDAHTCPISVRRWHVCSTSTPWWRPGRHRAPTLLRLRSSPTVKQSSWTTETLHKVKRERHVKHTHVIHYMMFLWLSGLGLFVFFHVLLIVELWNVVNAKRARTGQWNCV